MKPEEQPHQPQLYELTWAAMRAAGSIAITAAVEVRGVTFAITAVIAIGDMIMAVRRYRS
ncbi:MAG TPA: hypothetical protein VFX60_04265 [Micromonospora sp.]|nr:hypothetical protein [Micromonospora sp.]